MLRNLSPLQTPLPLTHWKKNKTTQMCFVLTQCEDQTKGKGKKPFSHLWKPPQMAERRFWGYKPQVSSSETQTQAAIRQTIQAGSFIRLSDQQWYDDYLQSNNGSVDNPNLQERTENQMQMTGVREKTVNVCILLEQSFIENLIWCCWKYRRRFI